MPQLSTEAWRERLSEFRAMRDQLENSTLFSKTKEAGRQLSEAFRNEFLSLLVHAFSKIRDTRDDPPPILRRRSPCSEMTLRRGLRSGRSPT
jgi:hypothetical protein